MSALREAATVIIARQGAGGPEVLLLRRSAKVGFFPMAWVFPGGRLDPADVAMASHSAGDVAGLPDVARPLAVAAVRECFEESGVWLGSGTPPDGLREALNAGSATLSPALGLVPDLARLRLWSRWVTPVIETRRYDTWFFLTVAPPSQIASHDDGETVDSAWVRPADVLHQHERFPLAPPTFRTLEELATFDTVDAMLAVQRRVHPVCPRLTSDDDGVWTIVLPGDPSYPVDDFTGAPPPEPVMGPTKIGFNQGRWWSHR